MTVSVYLWDVAAPSFSSCGKIHWQDLIWKNTRVKLWADNIRVKTKPCGVKNWLQSPETGLFPDKDLEKISPKTVLLHWRFPRADWPPSLWKGGSVERARLFPALAVWAGALMERDTPKNKKSSLVELQGGCVQMGQSSSTWTAPRWGWPGTGSSRNLESLEDLCAP